MMSQGKVGLIWVGVPYQFYAFYPYTNNDDLFLFYSGLWFCR